ncbi:copper ion binding protein [Methanolapillus millepedarum]|uniref:Copper chaperone CopZ n=1 Tax=Methanolapillus millepedarum TaxID=3028296 RepID=A0AA96V5S8_9EURY|nr:Copper chaperone CopZ [Methanosarcinaceae archaeon Ac7]
MQKVTFKVGGMTCGHCQKRVQKAILESGGVTKADVDVSKGEAAVEFDETKTNLDKIKAAVQNAGYKA